MKNYTYIQHFPKPFLNDLIKGRVLPFIGAGFSKNAEIPSDMKMLDWDELGRAFADDIIDYKYSNALDAISAYTHEYHRVALVEKLSSLLLINSVKPGNTHKAFCNLQFDIVTTTNFEFLLEKGYTLISKPYYPIIDEEQLSISHDKEKEAVTILKIHGDLNHPTRLVATEEDYDRFLSQNPMLATFLGNLLITRTALFIGYSLDDTDFRQVWQLIKDRLGNLRRQAYVLKVNCSQNEKARYERRGVKVIDIPGSSASYGKVLEDVFIELRQYWLEATLNEQIVSEDLTLAELSLPAEASNRLCFFSVPLKLLPYYKKYIFPVVYENGLIPIGADDIINYGENWLSKVTALIKRSEFFIVDLASKNTVFELGIAINKESTNNEVIATKILIINEEGLPVPSSFRQLPRVERPSSPYDNPELLINAVNDWLNKQVFSLKTRIENEPKQLLAKKEFRSAVVSAISLLEIEIRQVIDTNRNKSDKLSTTNNLFQKATNDEIIAENEYERIKGWVLLRNRIVHENANVDAKTARDVVNGITAVIKNMKRPVPL